MADMIDRVLDSSEQVAPALNEIKKSLQKSGTDECVYCDKPIEVLRKRALPSTELCIDCARMREGA